MDEAWKTFEVSGKVTDYLNYCRKEGMGTFTLQGKSNSEGMKDAFRESKERVTGWDRQSY